MNTKHLKAKILDLAIRGKLVEQKAEDGNAFDLLQKIREEKMPHGKMSHGYASRESDDLNNFHSCKRHASNEVRQRGLLDFANAKSRKNKQQTETALAKVEDAFASDLQCDNKNEDAFASDLQFEIPENWCWCRLGEICKLISGQDVESKFYNSEQKGIPYITGASNFEKEKIIINRWTETPKTLALKNDLLITCKGTVGKLAFLNEEKAHIARQIMAIRPFEEINRSYLKHYIFHNIAQLEADATSMIPGISRDMILQMFIPLPPLAEQKRIVSAIEKAFEQIDIIEKNKLNLKTYIKQTKSKVLDLAIRGKLVEQNAEDGNAFDLLQKIREEKMSHGLDFANAKSKKNKQQTETALAVSNLCDNKNENAFESEIPFEIPENWCWCRLGDVCKEISDLDHRMPKPFPNGIPYISPLDFTKDGKINLKSAKKISLKDYEDLSKKSRPEKGDIIFPRYGTIGKIRCIDFEEPCLVSYSCATIKVNLNNMNNEYIKYVLASPLIQTHEIQKYINETTQANIGLQSIKDFKFPLPPLPEQKRIVAKIEQVFEQLDVLEKSLGE